MLHSSAHNDETRKICLDHLTGNENGFSAKFKVSFDVYVIVNIE